jgi:hypothetical protein
MNKLVIEIQDEAVIETLLRRAAAEHTPVATVVEHMLQESLRMQQDTAAEFAHESTASSAIPSVREILDRHYARARAYWESVGDTDKALMTDAQLDEQFWLFDGDGIPRLKSEQGTVEIPEESSIRLGEIEEKAQIYVGKP